MRTAMEVLWSYLSDSAVSPLHGSMIEIEEPYCTDISTQSIIHKVTVEVRFFPL